MRKRQKKVERLLVGEFLENALGVIVRRLLGRVPPRPDVYAVIEKLGRKSTIEVELTEYQVDTPSESKGGSPGARLNSYWQLVQQSLHRRLTKKDIIVRSRQLGESFVAFVPHKDMILPQQPRPSLRLARKTGREQSEVAGPHSAAVRDVS
jgi:hypothetical protein